MISNEISSIEISFPFSMWNSSYSLLIYEYTIEQLLIDDLDILIHIDDENNGSLYNSNIDRLLCKINKIEDSLSVSYPSLKINGSTFGDTSLYINIKEPSILLKDIDGNSFNIYNHIKYPPKSIKKLQILIEGNIEYYTLD